MPTPEYRVQNTANIIKPPSGEVIVTKENIIRSMREKNVGSVVIGFTDRTQKELSPDGGGIAYVDMNSSGRMTLEQGEDGVIATGSLAGCTGVAGFVRRRDGSIATFVSHYDSMSQNSRLTSNDSPVNSELYGFRYQAEREGLEQDSPILYLVAYPRIEHHSQDYGQKKGLFKDWNYIDQINTTVSQLGNEAQVLMLPYEMNQGHTLASGRVEGQEGIFWDGIKVDFDAYLSAGNTHALCMD